MMTQHTKEPWHIEAESRYSVVALVDAEGYRIAEFFGFAKEGIDKARKYANINRAMDCVNACKDISDPEAEITQLRQDKVELLEALEEIKNLRGTTIAKWGEYDKTKLFNRAEKIAKGAIAKATK